MNGVIDKEQCSGCGVCSQKCPVSAIRMVVDAEGFAYPVIDKGICKSCGICTAICPVSKRHMPQQPIAVYIAWSKDAKIRQSSSSGGVFWHLARAVIATGGVVFGVGWKTATSLACLQAHTIEELAALRGSKYIQIPQEPDYGCVRECLEQGKMVLFTGTPCQVAGLYAYLGKKKYELLYTAALICHGITSALVFDRYRKDLERNKGSAIRKFDFRNKCSGWFDYSFKVLFDDGSNVIISHQKDDYWRAYIGDVSLRPSCHHCSFRSLSSGADIVLGDCWNASELVPEEFDDGGYSVVCLVSEKGLQLFQQIINALHIRPSTYERAKKGNPSLVSSPLAHSRRPLFFHYIQGNKKTFQWIVDRCMRPTVMDQIRHFLFRIMCKIRLILHAGS